MKLIKKIVSNVGKVILAGCLGTAITAQAQAGKPTGTVCLAVDMPADSTIVAVNTYSSTNWGSWSLTSANVPALPSTTSTNCVAGVAVGVPYFFSFTSVNAFGVESSKSTVVTNTIPVPVPLAPLNPRVVKNSIP